MVQDIQAQSVDASNLLNQDEDGLEPLAVTEFALRYPQDAKNPQSFWQNARGE